MLTPEGGVGQISKVYLVTTKPFINYVLLEQDRLWGTPPDSGLLKDCPVLDSSG